MEIVLDHERLEVYQLARQLNREVRQLVTPLPRGVSESIDNLVRAAKSVQRNIAEGAGKWRVADKIRFYHIARASATECCASLDELVDWEIAAEPLIARPKQTAARIVVMLIAMIRSTEARGRDMGR
jgi:four helix bundle protein